MNQTNKKITAFLASALFAISMFSLPASAAPKKDTPRVGPAEAISAAQSQTEEPAAKQSAASPAARLVQPSNVLDSFYNNAVFVGDSISLQLRNYVLRQRKQDAAYLGSAQFLTVGGLGSGNVQLPLASDSLHPVYNGERMYLEDSIAATGATQLYIMLGMNDIVPYGIDGAISNLDTLISKILEKSPDISVTVQSVTPMMYDKQQRNLNNPNILSYNAQLEALCAERGYTFLDVGARLRDENDALPPEYCGDAHGMGLHLTNAACLPWISLLREHAAAENLASDLSNPATISESDTQEKEYHPEVSESDTLSDLDWEEKEFFPEEEDHDPEPNARG